MPFFGQFIVTKMVEPTTEVRAAEVHETLVTVTNPGLPDVMLWGAVQPAGISMETWELALKSLPFGVANVKVKLLPVLPAPTLVGETVIVPSPSLATPEMTYGPTIGPPLPRGAAPAGWIAAEPVSPIARPRLSRPFPV